MHTRDALLCSTAPPPLAAPQWTVRTPENICVLLHSSTLRSAAAPPEKSSPIHFLRSPKAKFAESVVLSSGLSQGDCRPEEVFVSPSKCAALDVSLSARSRHQVLEAEKASPSQQKVLEDFALVQLQRLTFLCISVYPSPDDSLSELGLDSLSVEELAALARQSLSLPLTPQMVLQAETPRELAKMLVAEHPVEVARAALAAGEEEEKAASLLLDETQNRKSQQTRADRRGSALRRSRRFLRLSRGGRALLCASAFAVGQRRSLRKTLGEPGRQRRLREAFAVTGVGCRLPASCFSPESFWHMLCEGKSQIDEYPLDRCIPGIETLVKDAGFEGATAAEERAESICPPWMRGGYLKDARCMDPQQRLLLEVAHEALTAAGVGVAEKNLATHQKQSAFSLQRLQRQSPDDALSVAVFVGSSGLSEWKSLLPPQEAGAFGLGGVSASLLAARVSRQLRLTGPSMTVDSACASGLVALHLAQQTLASGTACGVKDRRLSSSSRAALVCGSNVVLDAQVFSAFAAAGTLSLSGRCLPFSASADGCLRGEAAVALFLQRPQDVRGREGGLETPAALCFIRSSAVRQAPRTHSLSAPSQACQETLLREALQAGGLRQEALSLLEVHGTGTALGDPIEAAAVASVFSDTTKESAARLGFSRRLCVSWIKDLVGHSEGASGLVGLLKAVLCLIHKRVPPSLPLRRLHPRVQRCWSESRVLLPTKPVSLTDKTTMTDSAQREAALSGRKGSSQRQRGDRPPLFAGVTALGFAGSMAHAILEENPAFNASRLGAAKNIQWRKTRLPLVKEGPESAKPTLEVFTRHWKPLGAALEERRNLAEMVKRESLLCCLAISLSRKAPKFKGLPVWNLDPTNAKEDKIADVIFKAVSNALSRETGEKERRSLCVLIDAWGKEEEDASVRALEKAGNFAAAFSAVCADTLAALSKVRRALERLAASGFSLPWTLIRVERSPSCGEEGRAASGEAPIGLGFCEAVESLFREGEEPSRTALPFCLVEEEGTLSEFFSEEKETQRCRLLCAAGAAAALGAFRAKLSAEAEVWLRFDSARSALAPDVRVLQHSRRGLSHFFSVEDGGAALREQKRQEGQAEARRKKLCVRVFAAAVDEAEEHRIAGQTSGEQSACLSMLLPLTPSRVQRPPLFFSVCGVGTLGLRFAGVVCRPPPFLRGAEGEVLADEAEEDPLLREGTAVCGMAFGCIGSHCLAEPQALVPVFPGYSFEAACTLQLHLALLRWLFEAGFEAKRQSRVYVHGAAKGVGLVFTQLCLRRGCRVFSPAPESGASAELLASLGVEFFAASTGEGAVSSGDRRVGEEEEKFEVVVYAEAALPSAIPLRRLREGGWLLQLGVEDSELKKTFDSQRPDARSASFSFERWSRSSCLPSSPSSSSSSFSSSSFSSPPLRTCSLAKDAAEASELAAPAALFAMDFHIPVEAAGVAAEAFAFASQKGLVGEAVLTLDSAAKMLRREGKGERESLSGDGPSVFSALEEMQSALLVVQGGHGGRGGDEDEGGAEVCVETARFWVAEGVGCTPLFLPLLKLPGSLRQTRGAALLRREENATAAKGFLVPLHCLCNSTASIQAALDELLELQLPPIRAVLFLVDANHLDDAEPSQAAGEAALLLREIARHPVGKHLKHWYSVVYRRRPQPPPFGPSGSALGTPHAAVCTPRPGRSGVADSLETKGRLCHFSASTCEDSQVMCTRSSDALLQLDRQAGATQTHAALRREAIQAVLLEELEQVAAQARSRGLKSSVAYVHPPLASDWSGGGEVGGWGSFWEREKEGLACSTPSSLSPEEQAWIVFRVSETLFRRPLAESFSVAFFCPSPFCFAAAEEALFGRRGSRFGLQVQSPELALSPGEVERIRARVFAVCSRLLPAGLPLLPQESLALQGVDSLSLRSLQLQLCREFGVQGGRQSAFLTETLAAQQQVPSPEAIAQRLAKEVVKQRSVFYNCQTPTNSSYTPTPSRRGERRPSLGKELSGRDRFAV